MSNSPIDRDYCCNTFLLTTKLISTFAVSIIVANDDTQGDGWDLLNIIDQ
jgi:hypothetical protein